MNAKVFARNNYYQEKMSATSFKLLILSILLIFILVTTPPIGSNVLKYLDPGSGSLLLQTILGMSQCAICGLPVAAIGAVIYYFTKKRKNKPSSDTTKGSDM